MSARRKLGNAPLTADIAARAIIAAAASYGDDPLLAFTSPNNAHRRCLTAAADGAAKALDRAIERTALVFGVAINTVYSRRKVGCEAYAAAVAAAKAAAAAERLGVRARVRPAMRVVETAAASPCASARPTPQPWTAPVNFSKAPPTSMATLAQRVLDVLATGPSNAPSLAILCDAKGLVVGQTLEQLRAQGLVVAGDVPESGRRDQMWRMVGGPDR